MNEHPKIESAPGLIWRRLRSVWEARWQPRSDLIKRGCPLKSVRLWAGSGEPTETELIYIADVCRQRQDEMLVWSRGGLPQTGVFDGTLKGLIEAYTTDKDSTFKKLRYRTRQNHVTLLRRLIEAHGHDDLRDINARALKAWHEKWSEGGKIAMAHAFIGQLRTTFGFGATMLEDPECDRLCGVMHRMRFKMSKPRTERMTAAQAIAIRTWAHKMGMHSIALAQAFQFELMLRQKDVIGEWVPCDEPGLSDIVHGGFKWITGLRWSEINDNLILRHTTSKRQKDLEVDLKLAGMVCEEFDIIRKDGPLPTEGPLIISEWNALPYPTVEFRRKWRLVARAAGVPDTVYNMDSRAGGITEATDAGAALEDVRHAATHSDIAMTQKYSRGSTDKVAKVMQLRADHRNKK